MTARYGPEEFCVSKVLSLALALAAALPLQAGTPRIASTASARDFLAGDAKGTAVTADGRLTLGIPLGPKLWPEDAADAVVFGAASDSSGRVYVATGGGLGRLFTVGTVGKVSVVFRGAEANVTAVAVGPDGTVVCATSPNGKIYRIDTGAKDPAAAGTDWGSPQEAAIWALAFGLDGTLYVGTGNKGRIWRRTPSGKLEMFLETEDVHVRSLFVGRDGTVYVGTSDRGLLIAATPDGKKRTLHDFSRPEVVGIVVDASGTIHAAAASAEAGAPRTTLPDVRVSRPAAPTPTPTPSPAVDEETPRGSVAISTRTSRLTPTPAPGGGGSSEVVAISSDGFVEPEWTFPEEAAYSIRADRDGSLLVSTGARGRVYALKDRRLRLVAQTGERLAVAAPPSGPGFAVVTMGAPGVFLPASGTPTGTFTSAVRDASRLSAFGRLRYEGVVPEGCRASFDVRAGNSDKPDGTWTEWVPVAADGSAKLPGARFFQWRTTLSGNAKGAAPSLERVEFSYAERNARPVLESVTVLEPGAVIPRPGTSGSNILSVTNPDENGIYAGLEPTREATGTEPGARRLYRKGFRTITWRGIDPNGDPLRYDVDARKEGTELWFPIRKDVEEPFCSFDTTALPDGRYRFRVTASDRLANPEPEALTATEESAIVIIDNTPPVVKVESAKVVGGDVEIRLLATDALSPVAKAEGAVNADRWRPLAADDGAGGSPVARFVFRVPKPEKGAVLSIRVLDAAGNWAAASVEYPRDFR